ncbi:MAG TPA: aspartyl/asparaginyl beta-hydroxylase domain-containing protein [Allosphingosinicella sp.]
MKLPRPLVRLPMTFDAEALAREVASLPPSAWQPHPDKLPGNEAVLLVTPEGRDTNAVAGPMAPTPHLLASDYMMAIMSSIGAVWGRSRLMRLAPGAVVPPHVDVNYYWRTHLRLHIPIATTPDVLFTCGDETVHMKAGECWVFDTWKPHHVLNGGPSTRVHLVLDTVGGEQLWELIESARDPERAPRRLEPGSGSAGPLRFEQVNSPGLMSPWEVKSHVALIAAEAEPGPLVDAVVKRLGRFEAGWEAAWAQYGPSQAGLGEYRRLLIEVQMDLDGLGGGKLRLRNGVSLYRQLALLIFNVALPAGQ